MDESPTPAAASRSGSASVPVTRIEALIDRYDALLFDAYGVLVHAEGAMPGAADLLRRLNRIGKPYHVLTNDASKLPETAAVRYRGFGLEIGADRIVSSGLLLESYFAAHALRGARCAVLGTHDSQQYVVRAGGEVVPADSDFEVLAVVDQTGFPFLDTVDAAITTLFRLLDAGRPVHLLLPNPDLIYSRGVRSFGIAAGSVALLVETALRRRYREAELPQFVPLGKPLPYLYEESMRRCGTRNVVMLGDQLETDIAGANACGIDSVLVTTGVSTGDLGAIPAALQPTWTIDSIALTATRA